jgi:hypothetical protein
MQLGCFRILFKALKCNLGAFLLMHTLTHKHPLGCIFPLNYLFDVGPFDAPPGGREVPNKFTQAIGTAP